MRLYIDGKEVDITDDISIEIFASQQDFTKIESAEEVVKRIRIPATLRNRKIMAHCEQILSTEMFNQKEHDIEVEEEGIILLKGKPCLAGSEATQNGEEWYIVDIVIPVPEWIKSASENLMRETDIEFGGTIGGNMVLDSWTWDCPVRFFPVQRDRYDLAEYENEAPVLKTLTYEDYHPFVNIKALADAIVQAEGYSIESQFMDSEYFRSLYMSGYYPSKDIELIKTRMNFFAGKLWDSSTTANELGVVFTDANIPLNSINNIVDTADPYIYSEGKRISGAFNYGGCFKTVGGNKAFVPSSDVMVGFEYRFIYTCNFEPISETKMKGFTIITLEDEVEREVNSVNIITDWREKKILPGDYTIIIFDYNPSLSYKLVLIHENQDRSTITLNEKKNHFNLNMGGWGKLYEVMGNFENLKDIGWAIYNSVEFTEATQNVVIDVTLRSNPSLKSKNSAHCFNTVRFSGAEGGARFTLCADSSVRPVFYVNPMEGSSVTFNEIFAHEQKQLKLFSALKHLFDFGIYTNTASRKIYIEPRDDFSDGKIVDWTKKLDTSKPVIVEEMGRGEAKSSALLYTDDDGTVMRWNEANKKKFGRWTGVVDNVFAKDKDENSVNPLFAPSINETYSFPQAWSSSWLKVGNRDRKGDNYDDGELNFAPKIVRYMGMKPLAESESWGYPSFGNEYPLIAFHHSDTREGFTLCFDDFEGEKGLHKHHDSRFETLNKKKRITAFMNLDTVDIHNILYPGKAGTDMRAIFRLKMNEEIIDCRLEEISDYVIAADESVKCVFVKL